MPLSRRLLPGLIVCLLAAWCPPAQADDAYTPRPQRVFAEKPRIEDYSDYSNFLVDVMEYRRQKEAAAARSAPAAGRPDAIIPATVSADPALYHINGPESLEDALARAKKLPHPSYSEPERFGRTTASSFPIQPLDGDDMAHNEVPGQLADLETLKPDTYEPLDEVEEEVADAQGRKPTNDAQAREQKADQDADLATSYALGYDSASRTASDSEGRRVYVPYVIPNEVGYTVIRRADFSAGVIKSN